METLILALWIKEDYTIRTCWLNVKMGKYRHPSTSMKLSSRIELSFLEHSLLQKIQTSFDGTKMNTCHYL